MCRMTMIRVRRVADSALVVRREVWLDRVVVVVVVVVVAVVVVCELRL